MSQDMSQNKFYPGDVVDVCIPRSTWQGCYVVIRRHRMGYPWSRLGEYIVKENRENGKEYYATEGRIKHALNPKTD